MLDGLGKPANTTALKVTAAVRAGIQGLTLTTDLPHQLTVGKKFVLEGFDPPLYDAQYTVDTVVSTTVLTTIVPIEGGDDVTVLGRLYHGEGSNPGNIYVEKFRSANFLLLGIPLVLGP